MNKSKVRVLVLRAAGVNCDEETAHAWREVGAAPDLVHVNRLIETPAMLRDFAALTVPGGFSYGDDVAAGKLLANQLAHHLADELCRFVEDGKLVLGICNGFQVLVKAGLLPGGSAGLGKTRRVTIGFNAHGRFEDRWVHLRSEVGHSPWLKEGDVFRLPVAHAEGRVLADSPEMLTQLGREKRIALRYVDAEGRPGAFPINPNGSEDHVAGLVDSTGRVLGLMPHPERNFHPLHDPLRSDSGSPPGRLIFGRACSFLRTG